jgi:8-oxo-dGTP diphosphatase
MSDDRLPYQAYVNGFCINLTTQQVLCIEKQRPLFQKGKWNGIGGKIEPGENPKHAMAREFHEECGVLTDPTDWQHTLSLEGSDFVVHFYRRFVTDFPLVTQTTDERLGFMYLKDIMDSVNQPVPVLANMRWILPFQFFGEGYDMPLTVRWLGRERAVSNA